MTDVCVLAHCYRVVLSVSRPSRSPSCCFPPLPQFFYPGTGAAIEHGEGPGEGFNVNIPFTDKVRPATDFNLTSFDNRPGEGFNVNIPFTDKVRSRASLFPHCASLRTAESMPIVRYFLVAHFDVRAFCFYRIHPSISLFFSPACLNRAWATPTTSPPFRRSWSPSAAPSAPTSSSYRRALTPPKGTRSAA